MGGFEASGVMNTLVLSLPPVIVNDGYQAVAVRHEDYSNSQVKILPGLTFKGEIYGLE